jgi:Planctomycete cytochrome C
MSQSAWKTGPPVMHTQQIAPLTGHQIAWQLIGLGLMGVVWIGILLIVLNATGPGPAVDSQLAPASVSTAPISFSHDVLPVLTQICVKCHSGENAPHSLVLTTYADVMAGSENGDVIEPGDPANSALIEKITNGKMPKNSPHLLPGQIRAIVKWVREGAPNN